MAVKSQTPNSHFRPAPRSERPLPPSGLDDETRVEDCTISPPASLQVWAGGGLRLQEEAANSSEFAEGSEDGPRRAPVRPPSGPRPAPVRPPRAEPSHSSCPDNEPAQPLAEPDSSSRLPSRPRSGQRGARWNLQFGQPAALTPETDGRTTTPRSRRAARGGLAAGGCASAGDLAVRAPGAGMRVRAPELESSPGRVC